LEAYWLAIQEGADYIEPDLVSTKDGVLVARHENEIGGTTNVASSPFANRRTTRMIDGVAVTGTGTPSVGVKVCLDCLQRPTQRGQRTQRFLKAFLCGDVDHGDSRA